jgi:hypothetical protein
MTSALQIVADCPLCAVVVGKGDKFSLIPLDGSSEAAGAKAQALGYHMLGVFGFDGCRAHLCWEDPDASLAPRAAQEFAEYVRLRLGQLLIVRDVKSFVHGKVWVN